MTDLETSEFNMTQLLNEAGKKLSKEDFERLAESIISYIDEIGRSNKVKENLK